MAERAPRAAVLATQTLDVVISALVRRGYTVIGPTVRDGAIVLDELHGTADLPVGWGDEQGPGTYRLVRRDDDALFGFAVGADSPRRYLSPPDETILSITRHDDTLDVQEPALPDVRYAFVGARACELAAIDVQDHVFVHGTYPDPRYGARRAQAFVVAVSCAAPAATCFCTSMGTGPEPHGGYDLLLTEIVGDGRHRFLVQVGSDAGAELLAEVPSEPATDVDLDAAREVTERSADRIVRRLDPEAARDVLAANLDHRRWDDVASRCLSCASCTLVCPTCFCNTVYDVTSLADDVARRKQRWESCFSLGHSYVHGVGPVRRDVRSRYRQWLTHKLSSWWEQFDRSGCVGCGRCITWCPAGIDLTEEVAAIAADAEVVG